MVSPLEHAPAIGFAVGTGLPRRGYKIDLQPRGRSRWPVAPAMWRFGTYADNVEATLFSCHARQ